ncbi:hypothetical protein D1174_13370 [Enterobacter cloacae]|nr:hypothetical protein D1176_14600 [Enterobacter cloacae]KAA3575699.1 hypothetical protein D1177_14335 [Enterobacter cloacae]KAA3587202.1 hypothetical protein D1175_16195 [Enterobacter cloacae]KAA3589208.1 hypothetical protein D1174_13370 [Enterobacter cloacae]RDB38617.1 hypothetical protein DPX44_16445 [Enterobacter cloacae]
MPVADGLAILRLRLWNRCNKIAIKPQPTFLTILSRFFSKNESLLAIRFNSFIKIPAPEILPS